MHRMETRSRVFGQTALNHSQLHTQKYVSSHRKNDGIRRAAFPVLTYVEMHSANIELANELNRSVARRAQDAMIGGSSSHLHSHAEGATLLCADTHADGTFTTD